MKTYSKTHTSVKAANAHEKKIKARGGKVERTESGGKIVLKYKF
jgi:hypothetical protein